MIEINLHPTSGKKKQKSRQSVDVRGAFANATARIRDKWLIGTVVVSAATIAAVGFMQYTQLHREEDLRARLEVGIRDSTRYAMLVKDRIHAEAVRDTLLRQVNLIRTIDEDRFIWPHVMEEVSRALPQYTWVTMVGLVGTPQGATNVVAAPPPKADPGTKGHPRLDTEVARDQVTVQVNGRTVDIQALTRFMKDIEASPFLGTVNLLRSELALDLGKEVTQFQLTAGFTRPDSLSGVLRRTAFSLAGER
jgi:Tfp pilus assembly protein PilN